ncbi:MAG: tryptophan--tRNA ligase [Proteobacteria bacterium]|nr:MAG: tryptophan--tRNA ligase [Pseudomonadota bacterium]
MTGNHDKKVILSGIQPTNKLTLGNYLGAIKNWVRIQNDYNSYFMAVDQHAMTARQDPEALRKNTLFSIACYIAAGIDTEKCVLFVQSHVPQHSQLAWTLNCFGYMGELSRMIQYKEKSAKTGTNIPVGLFTYPLLMAADILLYDTTIVPVGEDQTQHVELTRDLAERMNGIYGDDTFVVPKAHIPTVAARVMDLLTPTSKMSKSAVNENGSIFLSDSPADIEKKFKRATTDSETVIAFDSQNKAGVSNLLSIQSAITGESIAEVVARYEGKQYGHLKVETAQIVIKELSPIQKRAQELVDERTELNRILKSGAERAIAHAERTIKRVHERIGYVVL